ncbi:ABC transporter permease subunit [bacterium 1xD42-67]|nr:ABC transporter permease subunit [bacterium 1xD42-67]
MSFAMIWDHLSLVLSALILAAAAGVPLGLLAYLCPVVGKALLWVVDLIQTIPALALLGVIMVFAGPGSPTAMIGLALYSLLPIARNCVLGLSQVPGHLKEAAAGMGMGPVYRLFHVDIPLAAPMLITGIRIAAVNAIGTAVFASFVGGGGLGGLFYTAIRQQDMGKILAGTAVLMGMALALDAGLGYVERRLSRDQRKKLPVPVRAVGSAALALACIALVVSTLLPADTSGQLTLYDGDYSEVKLMHSMVEQLVEDKTDLEVVILDQMTQVNNHNELKGSDPSCDLMFSYDGTVLTTFLGLDTSDIPAGETLYDFVNETVREREGLRLLGKVGLNNTYSIGVTQEVIDRYAVSRISDLVPLAGELDFGAEHEFYTEEGSMKYRPFADRYGLQFKSAKPVDVVLKYSAVESGAFDVMVVYATDGLNKRAGLTILEDDLGFFPEYYGAFLVREDLFDDFYEAAPDLEQVLDLLTGQVSSEDMVELTYAVDVDGRPVAEVAHQFLVSRGLLSA